jgi:hypothetical protein
MLSFFLNPIVGKSQRAKNHLEKKEKSELITKIAII